VNVYRPGVARDVVGDVLDREVVAERRGLHHDEGTNRRDEADQHVAPADVEQPGPIRAIPTASVSRPSIEAAQPMVSRP
jgi:hypothetical protein